MWLVLKNNISYCINCRSIYNICQRYYAVRPRKHPVDPEHQYNLPVFQYPVQTDSDRRVYVWGLSLHGALGNRLLTRNSKKFKNKLPDFHHKPLRHTFAEKFKVVDIACGYGFTLFAVNTKEKYKLFGCGLNSDSQVGYHAPRRDHPLDIVTSPAPIELPLRSDTKVMIVAAGRAHSLALTNNQGVFTLGNNAYGQCGRKVMEDERYSGSQVIYNIRDLEGGKITAIHCGQDHSLLTREDGALFSCGWGADGQLGRGDFQSQSTPGLVRGDVLHEKIVKVVGTGDCVLALNDKGEVFGWGNNEYNQLTPSEDMQQICTPFHLATTQGLGKIVDIAAGGSFSAVLNENGDVFTWGYGLLGVGPKVEHSKKPVAIPRTLFGENIFSNGSKVIGLASGLYHFAAVTSLGQMYTWGRNKGGCLGLGHSLDQYFPLKVNIGAHVIKVAAGVDHTVTLCKPFT